MRGRWFNYFCSYSGLFGIFFLFSFGVVQSQSFTQSVAKLLPEETFFLVSLEKPETLLNLWNQAVPGSLITDPSLQNILHFFLKEFFRYRAFENKKARFEQILSLSSSSDEGLALAGVFPEIEGNPPQLIFIAKASHSSKIKLWTSFFETLGSTNGVAPQRFQTSQGVDFYGVGLSGNVYPECYYGTLDQYFMIAFEKKIMESILSAIQSPASQTITFADNTYLQKSYADHFRSGHPGFFFYTDLAKPVAQGSQKTLGSELFENFQELSLFLEQFGIHKISSLGGALVLQENRFQDSVSAYFSENVALINLLKNKTVSCQIADICPKETAILGTISLSPEEITRWIINATTSPGSRRVSENEFFAEIESRFQFSVMNDFVGLLGNELSFYMELPFYGIFPKGALFVPLRSPEKFFEKLVLIISSQNQYSLESEEYLNHRFFYLKRKYAGRSYFGDPILISFTYLQGHFVISYHPAGIKSLIYTVQQNYPKLSASESWLKYQSHSVGKHQGLLYTDNQKVFTAIYEIIQQVSMFFLPSVSASLPDMREIQTLFSQSLLTLNIMQQQVKISCEGDAFGVSAWGYIGFYLGLTEFFETLHQNKVTLNNPK